MFEQLLNTLPEEKRDGFRKLVEERAQKKGWLPNPGPQTLAYNSDADILYYGGAGGGGKTDLIIGLALNKHKLSRVYRKQSVDLRGILQRFREVAGSDGLNMADKVYRKDGLDIEFSHMSNPGDEEAYQGRPRDLHAFDEVVHFSEQEVSFVLGWMRSAHGVKCRAVFASNPPMSAEGGWVIKWFAPWVDEDWPEDDRAAPGEIRWSVHDSGDVHWVHTADDHPGCYRIKDRKPVRVCSHTEFQAMDDEARRGILVPRSYTFIPAKLDDNPDLKDTDYRSSVMAMPEPLRSKLLYGDFSTRGEDDPLQIIPTRWIELAQERWDPDVSVRLAMNTLGADVAQGGADRTVFVARHDWWFGEPVAYDGVDTPDGDSVFSYAAPLLKSGAQVNIDLGGGWGNHAYDKMKKAGIPVAGMISSGTSQRNDRSGRLRFFNKRAEWWWTLREALDPHTGEGLALPPGREIMADLSAPLYDVKRFEQGIILVESKEDLRKRLYRSTDIGDAIVYAWADERPENAMRQREGPRKVIGGRSKKRRR